MTLTRKSLGAPEASSKHGARRVARYLRRRSIPVRVAALSAVLILAFIATNAIVIRELSRNPDRITAATELTCYGLTYWDFRPFVENNGVIAWKLLQQMAKLLRDTRGEIELVGRA